MISPLRTHPMEAQTASALPQGTGWQFEPKWDGFRCLAFRAGDKVDLRGKSGKPLGRYFPDVVENLKALKPSSFVVDGELVIPVGEALSFEALQMRLHPAESRVRKLAHETPATLVLFDMLQAPDGKDLVQETLATRRKHLEDFYKKLGGADGLRLSPMTRTRSEALRWLDRAGGGELDGVVAKELDGVYACGARTMIKVKCLRTADCVVGGFRYEKGTKEVGSLLLGLFDGEGRLDHVGFTSGIKESERQALTRRLKRFAGGEGFSGKAPGGPSRWTRDRDSEWVPLAPKLVVEVAYDHVTADRFRHGTRLLRWRPDKPPGACTLDQIQREARPSRLIEKIGEKPPRDSKRKRKR